MDKKKILIVDNNDSFTYNVVELIKSTNRKQEVDVISSSVVDISKIYTYDNIIISPGPGLPDDFPVLNKIFSEFIGLKPILGICLGHQAICQYFGADLINMQKVVHGQNRKITQIDNSILFKNIPKEFEIGLYHSWVVDAHNFPDALKITGTSEEGLIMSIEHKTHKLFGVQFHPESHITRFGKQLISNFLYEV